MIQLPSTPSPIPPSKLQRRVEKNEGKRDYKCPCGKTYLSYPALFTHIKQKHDGKAPGQIFKPKSNNKGRPPKKEEDDKNNNLYFIVYSLCQEVGNVVEKKAVQGRVGEVFAEFVSRGHEIEVEDKEIEDEPEGEGEVEIEIEEQQQVEADIPQTPKQKQSSSLPRPLPIPLATSKLPEQKSPEISDPEPQKSCRQIFREFYHQISTCSLATPINLVKQKVYIFLIIWLEHLIEKQQQEEEDYYDPEPFYTATYLNEFILSYLPEYLKVNKLEDMRFLWGENAVSIAYAVHNWIYTKRYTRDMVFKSCIVPESDAEGEREVEGE